MDLSLPSEHSPEDYAYLLSGRRSKQVPPSKETGIVFPINDAGTYYALPAVDRPLFDQFLADTGYTTNNVFDALTRLRRILGESPKADKLVPTEATVTEIEPDTLVAVAIWVSVVCFLAFFSLIIASSYYSDDESLTSAGSVFAALGLVIHFILMLLNGDCRKVSNLVKKPLPRMDPYHMRRSVEFFAILNRDLLPLNIHWKLGDYGTYIAIRRFTPKRLLS